LGIGSPHASASRAYSTKASAAIASATRNSNQAGASQTTPTASATRTAPLRTRVTRSLRAERDRRRLDAAVPAIALLVRNDCFEEVAPPEIGPQRFADPNLRVGNLPEQEVADAHLAARADQQIGIGLPRCVQEIAESPLVEQFGRHAGRDRATG